MALAKKGAKVGKVKYDTKKRTHKVRFFISNIKPIYPKSYEREYYRILKEIVKDLRAFTMEEICEAKTAIRGDSQEIRLDANIREGMIQRIKDKLDKKKTVENAKKKVKQVKNGVKQHESKNLESSFEDVLGVDVALNCPNADILADDWEMMQYDLIDNMVDTYENKLSNGIMKTIVRGLTIGAMLAVVSSLLSETENRAKFISTNEVGNLSSGLVKAEQEDVGVEAYQWLTMNDEKVRPAHQAREGEFFWWNRAKTAEGEINGQVVHLAPDFHPSEDYNCRCRAVPIFDINNLSIGRVTPLGEMNIDESLEVGYV